MCPGDEFDEGDEDARDEAHEHAFTTAVFFLRAHEGSHRELEIDVLDERPVTIAGVQPLDEFRRAG